MTERPLPSIDLQIGGKYGPDNPPLYAFSRKLRDAGFPVLFPKGDAVLQQARGFAVTHDSETKEPFDKAEIAFLRALQRNPVHIVCNVYQDADGQIFEGYMGEASSIESAYALAHNKPLVLMRPPAFAVTAPAPIQKIIEDHLPQITIERLDDLDPQTLLTFLREVAQKSINYALSDEDKKTVMRHVLNLARSYRIDWRAFKAKNP